MLAVTAACALASSPAAGRRPRPGSPQAHPPLPLRLSECQTRGGGAEAGAGGGGGGRGRGGGGAEGGTAQAGRLRAPHLLVGARPLAGSLWSATRSSRPGGFGDSADPKLPLGTRARPPPPVTSAETDRGHEKVRGKHGQTDCERSTRAPATSREIGRRRTPYLYYIPRRGGPGPRPLAARVANRRPGGRGLGPEGAGAGPAQRSRGGERGGGSGEERAAHRAAPARSAGREPGLPGWGPRTCVATRPADARGPWSGCPDPVLSTRLPAAARSRPPSAAGRRGPGGAREGHAGTPESRGLCPAPPRLPAPAPAAPSALPAAAVAVPARPSPSRPAQPAAPAPTCPAVFFVGGLNHLKQDDCQTHPGRQPATGTEGPQPQVEWRHSILAGPSESRTESSMEP
nr:translation initiation factor IF-2-like [Equus asinus]